ncbi:MAG: FxLYD domain-containing protein [Candidatus Altiarchaeota archaeon]
MKEDKKISFGEGGIFPYALLVVVLLTLSSGCLGGQTGYTVYNPNPPATIAKSTIQTLTEDTTAPSTTQATVVDTVQADFSKVSVAVDGCDDDYYMNAMVAGYVTNNGAKMMAAVPIVTQLQSSEGNVVSGGEKTTVITNLNPGETQKFSVIYVTPPQWKKCRASVNGDWLT